MKTFSRKFVVATFVLFLGIFAADTAKTMTIYFTSYGDSGNCQLEVGDENQTQFTGKELKDALASHFNLNPTYFFLLVNGKAFTKATEITDELTISKKNLDLGWAKIFYKIND